MKILWIVNIIFPYPANKIGMNKSCFGGWLEGLSNKLKEHKDITLAIATVYSGKEILEFFDGKIKYYLIPGSLTQKYDRKLEEHWKNIYDLFKPDIVHIQGTEFSHASAFINSNVPCKRVVSIQGLIYRCADVYSGNISTKEIIKNITLRDIVRRDNIFQQKKKFEKRGLNEIKIIKKSNNIIGRTTWDYANVKAINPNINYYIGNETLREGFYNKNWDINYIDRHTLFCSQANYPIKGFHYLVQAVAILKNKYPDLKLYVAGNNILGDLSLKSKLRMSGYAKYIKSLIKKYQLEKNIIFTGMLNEEQMVQRLLKTHVFVLPSTIENSSNSLGEAMLIGMPCVASNTGGTMDILEHKNEGFLYPCTEPAICAEYISRFFDNDDLATKLGKQAQITAKERHNPVKNVNEMIKIYNDILKKEDKI